MTVFEILHHFICHGNYAPTLSQSLQVIQASGIAIPYVGSLPVAGPACILLPDTRAPQFLFKSILAYNLAKHLGFEPMALNALNRLNTLPFSLEDPNVILEHIYMPSTTHAPHTDIRAWVRKWLAHRLFTTLGGYAETHKTNLGVLEEHPQLRDEFRRLEYESQYLADDALFVRSYFPVSRGPQTLRASPTPGLIDWPNTHTPTIQPTSSSIYGGPQYSALANIPAWQPPEVPLFPPVEPSRTSGSSVGNPLEEQRHRDERLWHDELAEFNRLTLRS